MAVKSTGVTQDGVSVATGRSRRKHSLVVFIDLATQLIGHASWKFAPSKFCSANLLPSNILCIGSVLKKTKTTSGECLKELEDGRIFWIYLFLAASINFTNAIFLWVWSQRLYRTFETFFFFSLSAATEDGASFNHRFAMCRLWCKSSALSAF